MRALIAFDKFKEALSAQHACEAARDALQSCSPEWAVDLCALTDGGEGFVDVLTNALGGDHLSVQAAGPRGERVNATIGFVEISVIPAAARVLLQLPAGEASDSPGARLAIVEMASVSGLALLAPHLRDPWQTSSTGTGQLIRAACEVSAIAVEGRGGTGVPPVGSKDTGLDHLHGRDACATLEPSRRFRVSGILLGIGGSATNDVGTGALAELGFRFLDANGQVISPVTPAAWSRVVAIQGQRPALPPIWIACDVTNPLTGPHGASAVYGPQKGLRADDVARMDSDVTRMAALLQGHCGAPNDLVSMPGAGAAGGIAFGLAAAMGAKLVNGFDLLCAWCDLEARLAVADVVLTGEGRFDATSLQGKGPGAIALRARDLGKAVHVFAGRNAAPPTTGVTLHEITPTDLPLAQALARTRENLAATVRQTFARP